MPNYCSNTLIVEGSKKDIAKFKKQAKGDFEVLIKKEDIDKEIKNLLNPKDFIDNLEEFVRLSKMSKSDILSKEFNYKEDKYGNWGHEPSDLKFNNFVPMPLELENTRSPMIAISEKEYKKQEEAIKNNKLTKQQRAFGVSRCLTRKLIKEYKTKFGADNWYDWNVNNWGTKWDVDATLQNETENTLEYTFDTAWSPPVDWLRKVAKQFPKLTFTMNYKEEGMGFEGEAFGADGEVSDSTWDLTTCSCSICGDDYEQEELNENQECESCQELNS